MPSGTTWVSPCSTSTSSKPTPSWSATICENVVTCPWPCGVTPISTRTVPVGSISMVAASQPPATYLRAASTRDGARPHISVQQEKPTPICLVEPLWRRSACWRRTSS